MKIGTIDLGERPVFLAPMEDVTDISFRLMCKRFGADMVYKGCRKGGRRGYVTQYTFDVANYA